MRSFILASAIGVAMGCGGPGRPVDVDTKNDACAFCRMAVSDAHLAAQIAAPGEMPLFFDDIGCLASYLKANHTARSSIFVADHRTGDWVAAASAHYSKVKNRSTPMASGFIAHADSASRRADPAAADSEPVAASDVFGELP